jgi:hypothetical protein
MKKLLLLLLLAVLPAAAQRPVLEVDVYVTDGADGLVGLLEIATANLATDTVARVKGQTTIGDGLAQDYRWTGSAWAAIAGTGPVPTVIDDDTMATATAANVPSGESVKAYVDTEVAGVSAGSSLDPFVIYALGQSNMSRVNFGLPDYDTASSALVKVWNDRIGTPAWQTWDVTAATSQTYSTASTTPSTTPAFHLAKQIAEQTGREVRVIIAAEGGQNLAVFTEGGTMHTRLITNIAAAGVTKADLVVLIQGEADDSGSDAQHNGRLQDFHDDMRALSSVAETTPIVLTEVNNQYASANRRMKAFAADTSFVLFAEGSGNLEMNGDGIHFTNNSCVAIGRGVIYATLFQRPVTPTSVSESRATVLTGEQYVTIPSSVYATMTGSFTFRCRWRPDFTSRAELINHGGSGYLICDFGRTTTTDGAFGVMLTASAQLYIWVNDYADRLTVNLLTAHLDTGNTLDLGVTWDSSTGLLTCYVDGVSIGSKTTVATGAQTAANLARLSGAAIGTKHAESVFKWAAFWTSALPGGTMTTVSDDLPDVTGALAAYKLNTPPNDRLFDHSGNSRHGLWVGTGAYSVLIK